MTSRTRFWFPRLYGFVSVLSLLLFTILMLAWTFGRELRLVTVTDVNGRLWQLTFMSGAICSDNRPQREIEERQLLSKMRNLENLEREYRKSFISSDHELDGDSFVAAEHTNEARAEYMAELEATNQLV